MHDVDEILKFWFGEEPARDAASLGRKIARWYNGGPELDRAIVDRFGAAVESALRGELDAWTESVRGRLALVLLLDQFTRSCFRGTGRSFAGDARAQALAIEALDRQLDRDLPLEQRNFLLMPLAHAEDVALQERSVSEAARVVNDAPAELRPVFAIAIEQSQKYLAVITRFGRFPHRNEAMGRPSTDAELEFLRDWAAKQPPQTAKALGIIPR